MAKYSIEWRGEFGRECVFACASFQHPPRAKTARIDFERWARSDAVVRRDWYNARGVPPRRDRKSSEGIDFKAYSCAPLRERVRNCMKGLRLQGCNRRERT